MDVELANELTTWLLWLTLPAANLFPIVYGVTSHWRDSLAGWALMVKSVSTLMLVDFLWLARYWQIDPEWAAFTGVVVMSLIFLGVTSLFVALMREKTLLLRLWLARKTR